MTIVEVLVLEGAMASSTAITLDVLTVANNQARRAGRPLPFAVRLWGDGKDCFSPFVTNPAPANLPADLLIVPAQGLTKADDIAARLDDEDVKSASEHIRRVGATGARIASSCTGTLLLAKSGLLDGRRATTSWWLAPLFQKLFPQVSLDTRDVVASDGPFITAGAAMAQMDVMVGLVARYAGAQVADGCVRIMLLDERRSQTPYMAVTMMAATDDRIADAVAWAMTRLEDGVGVNDLASRAAMSPRTFARHVQRSTGLSPVGLLQKIRVERAIELLETTRLPFEEIAIQVGYAEASTLRTLIRRLTGVRPRDVRARALPLAA
ncbi:GlxA family transcriptional regulator [Sphingomonas jaspsi]|uniref:GlxA family transcriptional regulator n=1 Tax=Sphingomonas jaspsi TaxID=392409 RepID=UPI0004B7AE52|nr:helix-turn-helix domain-containing protein [Sphingomonas jaspsi]